MHRSPPETADVPDALAAVVAAIRMVSGLAQVGPDARLEHDLQLESVDLVALDACCDGVTGTAWTWSAMWPASTSTR